jgi:capsule biosynthesis phosphatase
MQMKRIIIDLDDTICITRSGDYDNAMPVREVIEKLREYKAIGFEIAIHTSRNMRSFHGEIGKINAYTLPKIINWLERNEVPFDEVHVGKPWCGTDGFYVDDKAIRPDEFTKYSYLEIVQLFSGKS